MKPFHTQWTGTTTRTSLGVGGKTGRLTVGGISFAESEATRGDGPLKETHPLTLGPLTLGGDP